MSNDKDNWQSHAEEITICYRLAEAKYPQYGRQIKNELAYWWFLQLLYSQVPQGLSKNYSREFIENFGIIRYVYMLMCKLLLSKSFSGIRKIFR